MKKIETIHAFVADDGDGEGLMAVMTPKGVMLPLVAADPARIESLRPIARAAADIAGRDYRLLRFSVREEIEAYAHQKAPDDGQQQ